MDFGDPVGIVPVLIGKSESRANEEGGDVLEAGEKINWESVREQFLRVSTERRLAWVRDMQSLGTFYDQEEGRAWTQTQLIKCGFVNEAVRIAHPERLKPRHRPPGWTSL